jgi:hypothetical protein
MLRPLLPFSAIALLATCDVSRPSGCAKRIFEIRITPGDTIVAVGATFTATATFLDGCGGKLSERITWSSTNSTVVAVDSLSGRVTAHKLGSARIDPTGTLYGKLPGPTVTVR